MVGEPNWSAPAEVLGEVDGMTNLELDALPFGAIQLDREGTILQFNEYEANLSNRRAPDTIGLNFFLEVAPCTNVRTFYGRFQEGIERGALHVTFPYRFNFKHMARDVSVTLFYSGTTRTVWVFVAEQKRVDA
jgi:photoactive yellow protein